MDKTIGQIYIEILEGLNSCLENDNFFKGSKVMVDKREKNNILTTELTPYFYDDSMNFKLFLVCNLKQNYISLELKYKYNENSISIYKGKTILNNDESQIINTGFNELDNWINQIQNKNQDINREEFLYDINKLIHIFEIRCKDYYLSAEKYFNHKKITDQLFEDMKYKEHKII